MSTFRNKVQLIGHLGADPEMKTLENGNMLARLRVATNETYKNAQGDKVTDTQWHTVVAWGKQAETISKFVQKGSEIMIEGRLKHQEYTSNDGQKRNSTEIVISEFMLMDKKQLA